MPSEVFHDGERAVQRLAGVTELASRVGRSIRGDLPPAARAFLADRRWIVIGALDADGRPWPAIRAGAPGFAHALDERTIRVEGAGPVGEPGGEAWLEPGALAGLIALDPATRRRLRFNGRVAAHDAAGLVLEADQVFSNCPKYIQRRDEQPADGVGVDVAASGAMAGGLSHAQRDRLRAADTFFIASARPGEGVDVSHRGGMPGFVSVEGDRITWPDYGGNAMFNTLGNLHVHPYAGLLVPDFEAGGALIVGGRATIDWQPEHAAAMPGAERVVTLTVDRVVEQTGVLPARFQLREYSPFNPR
jgi:predicted pyridoxine 5'-phosphate oxidase superfamily flavin-nucleotide-binding protein